MIEYTQTRKPEGTPRSALKLAIILLVLVLLLLSRAAFSQTPTTAVEDTTNRVVKYGDLFNKAIRVNVVAGGAGGGVAQLQARDAANTWTDVGFFAGNLNVPVNCVVGCSGSSFLDAAAFTFGTTTISLMGAVVDDVATNTVAENSAGTPRMTGQRILYFDLSKTGANATAIKVDGSAVTQPVSGTFFQATQPVSGTVTANQGGAPWTVVGNVASGAADSSNPLKIGGVFNTTQPTVTNGQRVDSQTTARGELLIAKGVSGFSIDNTGFNVNNTPAVSQSGTWTLQPGNTANTTPWLMDIRQFGGVNLSTGTGAGGTGIPRYTMSNDSLLADTTAAISITTSGATCSPTTNCASITLNSVAACAVLLTSLGTGGTVQFESSVDNGTFQAQALSNLATGAVVTSASATGTFIGSPAAMQTFRVRASALTSGTITGTIRCSVAPGILQILGGQIQIWDQVTKVGVISGVASLKTDLASVAGTATVNGGLAGSLSIGGTAANNAAINQNPVLVGIETVASGSTVTSATAGNGRRMSGDVAGNVFTTPPGPWSCNLQALAATLTQCQAAPASGYSLYLTNVIATTTTGTAGTFAIRAGTGSNCATGTIGIWPQPGGSSPSRVVTAPIVTAAPMVLTLGPTGIKVTAANALCVIGVATNTIDIVLSGMTAP